MKILTLNFLTCARKACKPQATSFPLHPADSTLEIQESDLNIIFLQNILPRLDWPALISITTELGLPGLQAEPPEAEDLVVKEGGAKAEGEGMEVTEKSEESEKEASQLGKDLHRLLIETTIQEGKLMCACCGHEYAIKEGIANFLLPSHLV
ncbi:Trm112p-domain-containing protein [Tothia fuscella]|uniref:Trm112p-domain-containing protein n=1 Tax=Tothia fuscella TaxID=1048955 RepID=A0A9P4TYI1_9PEZI|nr:Trm112p-domain-containing protein [Tothia fuscella]